MLSSSRKKAPHLRGDPGVFAGGEYADNDVEGSFRVFNAHHVELVGRPFIIFVCTAFGVCGLQRDPCFSNLV